MRISLLATAAVAVVLIGSAACSPKLEEGELLEKVGDTFTIRLSRTINVPIDKAWEGLQSPENLEKYSDAYQQWHSASGGTSGPTCSSTL